VLIFRNKLHELFTRTKSEAAAAGNNQHELANLSRSGGGATAALHAATSSTALQTAEDKDDGKSLIVEVDTTNAAV
jgi:hypothetical protein